MRQVSVGWARAVVLGLLALAATPTAVVAVDTGSQCVTSLLEDSETAAPLPSRLTSLLSPPGQARLERCDDCASYPALAASFLTQVTQAFCGVASSVAGLNVSAAPKPLTDPHRLYRSFTQCNIFNGKAREKPTSTARRRRG
jgi:Phytochelatin synthase